MKDGTRKELEEQEGAVLSAREVMLLLRTNPGAAVLADGSDAGTDFELTPTADKPPLEPTEQNPVSRI